MYKLEEDAPSGGLLQDRDGSNSTKKLCTNCGEYKTKKNMPRHLKTCLNKKFFQRKSTTGNNHNLLYDCLECKKTITGGMLNRHVF